MTNEKAIDILKGIKDGTACLMPNMPEDGEKAIDMAIRALKQPESNAVELISKQEAINVCERVSNDKLLSADGNLGAEECKEGIKKLPPIQPKRGHWIKADVCGDTTSWECSCCHNWTGLPTGWNVKTKLWFCPKCTADMREVSG